MRLIVTGGAGYIGSVVADQLVAGGHKVIVVDDLRKGHAAAVPPNAQHARFDLADTAALDALFDRTAPDAVLHFAAYSLVGESVQRPDRYYHNNVTVTLGLLDAMQRHGVRRLVFSSTAAVYGDPQRIPIVEDEPTAPTNPYGATKLAIEQALPWYEAAFGLRFVSLRYFNAAGATDRLGEDHDPESHLIPLLLQVALGQRPYAEIFGTDYPTPDGTCIRDYIHVSDLAEAHVLALEALDHGSRIYNLGNGAGFSVREVLETARRVTGHPIPAVEAPRRPGDPPRLVAASDRIVAELGWRPRFPDLEAIVGSAWEWARRHPTGYPEEDGPLE
ncbi:MAG: UDP-glucose 4-epimerase [Dehalococcoidia bacterium]|nr:MAG: UDP-glucose 4-epimerase [Dehalococcoidia bacterium]